MSRLQTFSATRFAAHAKKVYKNCYKSFTIIITVLEERDDAKDLLSKVLTVKFIGTLLGCIDIYRVIATASCDLLTVDHFPWKNFEQCD